MYVSICRQTSVFSQFAMKPRWKRETSTVFSTQKPSRKNNPRESEKLQQTSTNKLRGSYMMSFANAPADFFPSCSLSFPLPWQCFAPRYPLGWPRIPRCQWRCWMWPVVGGAINWSSWRLGPGGVDIVRSSCSQHGVPRLGRSTSQKLNFR